VQCNVTHLSIGKPKLYEQVEHQQAGKKESKG
jgi:hypothetical protein